MKTLWMLLIPFTALLGTTLFAEDDITAIFDDLGALDEPAPAAEPQTSHPAAEAPDQPEPTHPTTLQPPQQNTPVLYSEDASKPAEKPARSVQSEKTERPPLDIEKILNRGREAYEDGRFDDARGYFEAVLYDDPHNKAAIRWLKRVAAKTGRLEEKSYSTTRSRMLENVQAAWNTPKPKGKRPDDGLAMREPTETERRQQALRSKLESIRIPTVTFQNADIQQVVLELSSLFRKLDSEGKGVNLVAFGTSETLLPPVTFSGTDLTALETLDIITQMSGMKYDIAPNLVSLTPVNYEPPQQMVSEEFDVLPAVGAKMALLAGGETGPSGLYDVHEFFGTVPFPQGSSAQFNPEFNLLLAHNVPEHIQAVKALLERYNKKALEERSRQVEIETKFIEVAQGALSELGFEWTVGEPGSYLNNDTIAVPGGQKLFTDTLRTGDEALRSDVGAAGRAASFNAYADAAAASIADSITGGTGELLVQKIKGDIKLDLLIKALERQEGSDLLSAPKVLAKSGETASIHVGEIRRFPSAYDVIIERYAQPSLVPLDYMEYKTGVMLEVTPDVDTENQSIDLKLSPEIRELAGFDEQHVSTIWPSFGDEQINMGNTSSTSTDSSDLLDFLTTREENRTLNADRLIAHQPIFKSRKVETAVTLEDGSTIAMGGLIKERMETFKDSVPILGKIPLLGRLFRSEGERSVKRNLLIFVTANQVGATGYKKAAE